MRTATAYSRQQVAASLCGSDLHLIGSPSGDTTMIAAEQHVWNLMPPKLPRTGVLGKLKQPVTAAERVVHTAVLIAKHSWQESHDGIDHDHRGNLASVEDKVTDTQFFGLQDINHSLVETFVSSTQQ
jgi:hypothetical protein